MSNEKNLKKLNKSDVSNVSGGWYVRYETLILPGDDGEDDAQMESLVVYDDNGSPLGLVDSYAEAKDLARSSSNCTKFNRSKSTFGPYPQP